MSFTTIGRHGRIVKPVFAEGDVVPSRQRSYFLKCPVSFRRAFFLLTTMMKVAETTSRFPYDCTEWV